MRASASPSALETNITARITAGALYDVKDVDVSADGGTVLFAMRGPLTMNQQSKKPPCWRIWQYVIATDTLSPVIDPSIDPDPATVNDVSPHFLPDGRIVFSSTRQTQSQGTLLNEGFPQFSYQDEARVEPAFVLEVMNADGTGIHQISFNQSHDRDATVLMSGRVLWSRWDNAPGGKDQMSLYSSNPDGTDMQLYYGANSHLTGTDGTVIEFVHPHEMQNGNVLALIRQYTDVDDGGNLVHDQRHTVRGEHPVAARLSGTQGSGADGGQHQRGLHHPGTLARRALQFGLPALGRHRPHPGQLVGVPAARSDADTADHRAVHLERARRPQCDRSAAAL